jgi:hypothetical protein
MIFKLFEICSDLHLSCHAAGSWMFVASCKWLTISHFLAQPFFIAATWNTMKGRHISRDLIDQFVDQRLHFHSQEETKFIMAHVQQINHALLVVALTLGTYLFAVQSLFAISTIFKSTRSSTRMVLFKIGIILMIPLIAVRVWSVCMLFLVTMEPDERVEYALSYFRLIIEYIPENLTVLLAFVLAFLTPEHLPTKLEPLEKEIMFVPYDDECPQEVLSRDMAYTPLKVDATNILMEWYNGHLKHPFPTQTEKMELVRRTGFTIGKSTT